MLLRAIDAAERGDLRTTRSLLSAAGRLSELEDVKRAYEAVLATLNGTSKVPLNLAEELRPILNAESDHAVRLGGPSGDDSFWGEDANAVTVPPRSMSPTGGLSEPPTTGKRHSARPASGEGSGAFLDLLEDMDPSHSVPGRGSELDQEVEDFLQHASDFSTRATSEVKAVDQALLVQQTLPSTEQPALKLPAQGASPAFDPGRGRALETQDATPVVDLEHGRAKQIYDATPVVEVDTTARNLRPPSADQTVPEGAVSKDILDTYRRQIEMSREPSAVGSAQSVERARALFETYAFVEAYHCVEEVAAADPGAFGLVAVRKQIHEVYGRILEARLAPLDRRVSLAIEPNAIYGLGIDPKTMFLLTQVDGYTTIAELIDVSGLSLIQTCETLLSLLERQVLSFG